MPKRRFRRWIFGVCGILGSIVLAALTLIAIPLLVFVYVHIRYTTTGGMVEKKVWELVLPSVEIGIILAILVLAAGIVGTIDQLTIPTNTDSEDDLKCPQCNYDMRGSIAADNYDCPECGARYVISDKQIKIIAKRRTNHPRP